jgi:hypothetical protein
MTSIHPSIHILIGCYLVAKQKYDEKDQLIVSKTSKNGMLTIVLRDLMALADIKDDTTIIEYGRMIVKNKKQFALISLETGTSARGAARELTFNLDVDYLTLVRITEMLEESIALVSIGIVASIQSSVESEYIQSVIDTYIEECISDNKTTLNLAEDEPIITKKYSASNKRKSKKIEYSQNTIDNYSDILFSCIKTSICEKYGDNVLLIKQIGRL